MELFVACDPQAANTSPAEIAAMPGTGPNIRVNVASRPGESTAPRGSGGAGVHAIHELAQRRPGRGRVRDQRQVWTVDVDDLD